MFVASAGPGSGEKSPWKYEVPGRKGLGYWFLPRDDLAWVSLGSTYLV